MVGVEKTGCMVFRASAWTIARFGRCGKAKIHRSYLTLPDSEMCNDESTLFLRLICKTSILANKDGLNVI
jgi:hypothetical protein